MPFLLSHMRECHCPPKFPCEAEPRVCVPRQSLGTSEKIHAGNNEIITCRTEAV
ncbi:Uncharacterized protein dnm_008860 [Desulfonema magnum]|uniref:Uncharacterized protein n=1 Tax=Desulfonema magnum TaxID=45655 RepID=A0A975GLJ3_9BACT|nr:Uncharacterized protein dnm_008860 [Desulfonema magnum]